MKGSPPKRRSVLTVFDWSAEIIADWLERGHRHMTDGLDLFPTSQVSVGQFPAHRKRTLHVVILSGHVGGYFRCGSAASGSSETGAMAS
jgi:hypothetical protein